MAALVLVAVSLGLSNFAASVGIGVSGMVREPGCALG
jgi:putative Mn2+ efflux pump MntP